jgi:chromate transporter
MSAALLAFDPALLASLFLHMLLLSLLAVGGAIVVAPDMHRVLVDQQSWLTHAQFNASIAIAQAAPGPNVLFVGVMGLYAGGLAGALAALAGIMLPSTTLALAASRLGRRHAERRAVIAFRQGLAPVTLALFLATAWLLAVPAEAAAGGGWARLAAEHGRGWLLTLAVLLLAWRTRAHLLLLIGASAAIGAFGWV